jgi:CAAX protease family protein
MISVIKKPYGWVTSKFPELDFKSTVVAISGSIFLILFLYYGKPGHFFKYFPEYAKSMSWQKASMASYIYSHIVSFMVLFLAPILVISLVFKENPLKWGVRFKGTFKEFKIVIIMFLAFVPLLILMSKTSAFQAKYPKLKMIKDSAQLFFLYQGIYLIKWTAWEFFFRGYLLFGFKDKYGEGAILMSTMVFVIVHLGKPQGEIFAAIAAGFILCRLALDGKSIFPGVWLHFMVAGTMDFLNCTWW